MKRSYLEEVYCKRKTKESLKIIKNRKIIIAGCMKKVKKKYFRNLNPAFVSDNRKIWKEVKPLFSDKDLGSAKITLVKCKKILSTDQKVSEN